MDLGKQEPKTARSGGRENHLSSFDVLGSGLRDAFPREHSVTHIHCCCEASVFSKKNLDNKSYRQRIGEVECIQLILSSLLSVLAIIVSWGILV